METENDQHESDLEEVESPTDFVSALSAKERHRLETRPVIDHLPDAVVKDEHGNMVFLARPGDKIVIERYATVLEGRPWLDTKTYTVYTIDGANGNLMLIDEELQRQAMSNYITGTRYGYRFKLPTAKMPDLGKRRRGRPKKLVLVEPAPTPADETSTVKRGRGRPKGSKNRPAEVREAERAAKKVKKKRGRRVKSSD